MNTPGRTALTWLGRIFLLAIPYVLVANLLFPAGIAPLSPVLCPDGLTVETNGDRVEVARDLTSPVAVICTSENRLAEGTNRLYGTVGVFFLVAVAAYAVRNRLTPKVTGPGTPARA
ncbi:hypothetical protein KSP35_12370 [Aquihabitans sp. G128]|uniref:hypothetical protein n=1 Tax=Aquihabitans sp. G128 TaxID=2849779 RepID=UPI001C22FB6E|nr:hypothetical protein [Aquihabitans sp. G128]QXC59206.1 hypothetical protein KSP35_12370 [Aquihabitans sp. G128]